MNYMVLFLQKILTILSCIAGDFNADFSRPAAGPNCSNLSAFMLSNNLISVDQISIALTLQ